MFIILCYFINVQRNSDRSEHPAVLSRIRRETGENEITINSGRPSNST